MASNEAMEVTMRPANILTAVFTFLVLASATAGAVPLASNAAGAGDDPRALLNGKYAEIQVLVQQATSRDELQGKVRALMDSYVDYAELGRQCLGETWATLKPADQTAYLAEFKQMIQRSYVKRFDAKKTFTVEFRGDTERNGAEARVASVIRTGKSEAEVDYVLRQQPKGGWMAVDVAIDEVSWMRSYRKQFRTIVERDGFPALLAKLKKKNAAATTADDAP